MSQECKMSIGDPSESLVVGPARHVPSTARSAFTLVELLTVVFIISLLISILIPSLGAARNAAKRSVSAKTIQTVGDALEMFRNDNASDFPQTNGYPPSFAHPPIPELSLKPHLGQFPFLPEFKPVAGAHWLPAMLMGVDQQGYIKRSSVPNTNDLRRKPETWYTPNPTNANPPRLLERAPMYLDSSTTPTLRTKDLPGSPSDVLISEYGWGQATDSSPYWKLLTIVDGFDYPILYYAANKGGRPTNMVAARRAENNDYSGSADQNEAGVPYYVHEDNAAFTGRDEDNDPNGPGGAPPAVKGWDFNGNHTLGFPGEKLTADSFYGPNNRDNDRSFARWVMDRSQYRDLLKASSQPPKETPMRPVNADKYLLISPGTDGRYGTRDDVGNMPPFFDE